jgi:UDP-N-acetylglucosamine 4-epimerase
MYEKPFTDINISLFSFLVTGGAGFIGSHIVEYLVKHGAKKIVVLDNLATGFESNIKQFYTSANFIFRKGDICDYENCLQALEGIDYVFHQAALGSVPRSVENPLATEKANCNGFVTLLTAAKEKKVKRIVYASSSSVYGDIADSPKTEMRTGNLLSPYAASKMIDEVYAQVFSQAYNMQIVGLRYFNIFGPRQNPKGEYAAAIPLFIDALLKNNSPIIFGDGEQSRDFTFVANAVQANIKAAFADTEKVNGDIFNVACGNSFSVNHLVNTIKEHTQASANASYKPSRKGEPKNSQADVAKARNAFDYNPEILFDEGILITINSLKDGR